MRYAARLSAILSCLLIAHFANPGIAQVEPIDKLPPKVLEMVGSEYHGAELVAATQESEDGKVCYRVTLIDKGKEQQVYVSPDGRFIGSIQNELAVKDIPSVLFTALVIGGFGSIVAGIARFWVRAIWPESQSVLRVWIGAWLATAIAFGLLQLWVNSVPREKNVVLIVMTSSILGGVSASIVELLALTIQTVRQCRKASRWSIVVVALAGITFLCLSIPDEIYRRHWFNENCKAHAMRPPNEGVAP
jgi:hypothetical protein